MCDGFGHTNPSSLAAMLWPMDGDMDKFNNWDSVWYTQTLSHNYLRRSLTMPDDKLPALSGIARAFHQSFNCVYGRYLAV